ncbi:MAG: extracellular solute-binding protein [Elusimicrobia bacterium]|nr:extracellular solute-binding protein [Elusimicrobiota bacterium]MBD3411671.1 extracellular solute-binding protein [Elusimicrobiota bacterium]
MNKIFMYALCFLIVGCGSAERTNLSVVMSLTEEEWSVFRGRIFPLFEKQHMITINAYQITAGQLATKLEALVHAGRSEIDVCAQDNMSLARLVAQNLVDDLSEYENAIPSQVFPNLIDAIKFDGKLYFMPFRPNVQIVLYNKKKFSEYGIDPPRTWKNLLDVGRIFNEKEGIGRLLVKGYGGNPTATQVYEFILQAGGSPYAFNDHGCRRAFSFLQKLKPYCSPESGRAKWDTVNDILAHQEAYIAQNWPFAIPILIRDYQLDFIDTYSGWAGPAGEYHVIGGDVLGIPVNAKFKEQALEFIYFLQSKEVQEILVEELGWPSIRNDAYARVSDWQKKHFQSVTEALQHGVYRDNVPWWPAYKKYISRAFQDIVMDGADVKKTLDTYKTMLEEEKALYQ